MSMSKIIGGMGVTLWADSRPFKKGVKEAQDSVKQFTGRDLTLAQKRMKDWADGQAKSAAQIKMIGTVAKTAAVAGLAVMAKFANDTARSFDTLNSSMQRALSIFGKVSSETRRSMTESVIGVSGNTLFDSSQAAQALRFIGSAGYSAEQAQSMLPQFAEFAQAGQFDMAQAVNYAADAQAALGMKSQDTAENLKNLTRVTDVLTKANILSNAEVEDFAAALTNKAAGAIRLVGKDIEEGVAVLAAFAEQGIKGEAAGESLGIVMRDLQTKALKNEGAFKALGIAVFDEAGNMNNLADIVEDLEGALFGMSDAQRKSTLLSLDFQDKSVAFIQTLIGMSDSIRNYEKELRNAGGATKEVSDLMMTDAEKAIRRNAAAWDQLSQSVGSFGSGANTAWNNAKATLWGGLASDPMEGASMSERLRAAAPWNWKAPVLPGSKEDMDARAAATERQRRTASANAMWDSWDRLKSDPRGFLTGSSRNSAINSAIGSGLGFLQQGGRTAGNLFGRAGEAAKASEEAWAKSQLEQAGKLGQALTPLISEIKKLAYTTSEGKIVRDMASSVANAPWQLQGLLGAGVESLTGLERTSPKKPNFLERQALSFAESGSVESYRQQAAIRRQGDDIAKKQLGVQQQIRDGINNLADVINFPAANLGKG